MRLHGRSRSTTSWSSRHAWPTAIVTLSVRKPGAAAYTAQKQRSLGYWIPAMRQLPAHLAIVLSMLAATADAAFIVDTGTPNNTSGWSFGTSQYFAGEFSVGNSTIVNGVDGYFQNFGGPG